MNRQNKVRSKKIFILVSALMLMLVLCGCRTRITNNTEVIQTLEDDGMMQESYQIRRDELGIPVAETPLFKGWESDDDEYGDYDEYYEDFETYDEEVYDDFEDEEVTDPNNRQDTNPVNRQPRQPVRQPVQVTTGDVKVTFDANSKDAKCSPSFVMLKKGSTYGTLPVPTRDGYDFKGWYTAKTDGDKVTSKTKLKSDKAHTLYAHWEKSKKDDKEEDKKEEEQKQEEDKTSDPEPQPQPEPEPQPQ